MTLNSSGSTEKSILERKFWERGKRLPIAILLCLGSFACSGENPGVGTEKSLVEAAEQNGEIERAEYAVFFKAGVTVRKTPYLPRDAGGGKTDENKAYESHLSFLVINPPVVRDKNGNVWYGVPNENYDNKLPDTKQLEFLDWIDGRIIGQKDGNGGPLGFILLPKTGEKIDESETVVWFLDNKQNPQEEFDRFKVPAT